MHKPTLIFSSILTRNFSSSSSLSSQNLSKILSLQNLLKSGFSPTVESFHDFFIFLSKTHRISYLLHLFSQMTSNKILTNHRTRSIVARALLKSNKFEEAERFMAQMVKDGFSPQKGLWESLIQGICSTGKDPEKALSVLLDCLKIHGNLLSGRTFSILIRSFCNLGEMGRAIEVLEVMTEGEFRHPVDNFACSSLISGFCKIGKPELGLRFYENVNNVAVLGQPNIITYTALVSALCKVGRMNEVNDLVRRMEEEGVVFDAVFYSSWICGYFQEGILEETFRKHRSMLENGIKPDVVSYTILIDGFSKGGNVEKAIGFLNEMKKDGLEPNLVTYTAIIRGFCKRGKLEEAFSVFALVEKLGIEADEIMYSTLIEGLCGKGDLDHVFLLLEEMETKEVCVGTITYNTIINGLCKVGRTIDADEISNSVLFPDNFTFSTLLHGYVQERNFAGILETKKRLQEAGVSVDVVTCNVLIKALFLVGALEDAYTIFQGMSEMGLVANAVTYCTMIDGLCKVGRIDEALEIFDLYKNDLISSVACYNCIIHGLCRNGMVDIAVDAFVDLVKKSLVPDTVTYVLLIKSIYKKKNEEGVLTFLHQINKLELETFSVICNFAITFLCKKWSFEAAFAVYMMTRSKGFGVPIKCYYSILKGLIANGNKLHLPVMLSFYFKEYGFSEAMMRILLVKYWCKKNIDKALHFWRMNEEHLHLPIPLMVFEALTKQGRSLDAYRLIVEAEGNRNGLDVVAYTMVVDGLCKEGHLLKALDLCATMRKKGVSPNIVTYNTVINGLCQQGCIVEALRLFDSLEQIGLSSTSVTYGSLIGALSKEGYLQDAKQLFEKMVIKGFTPNIHIYNKMIDGYCKFGYLEEALRLLPVMEENFVESDSFTVSAVINGYCLKGDIVGAFEFYCGFQRKGITPDFIGFVYLIKGLSVKGWMEEARSVLREMLQIQNFVELINKAGDIIAIESLASFLVFLCEQGSIEEAISVLSEVKAVHFPSSRRSNGSLKIKKELKEAEASRVFITNSVVSQQMSSSKMRCSRVEKGGDDLDLDNSSRNSMLFEFDAFYSSIASLCAEGEVEKANQVARRMLLNTGRTS